MSLATLLLALLLPGTPQAPAAVAIPAAAGDASGRAPFSALSAPLLEQAEPDPGIEGAPGPGTEAGEDPYSANLYRRFSLAIGYAAYANFDTSIDLSGDGLVGANLDLEDELDVDERSAIARIDGHYSFARAHRIDFSYYDIRRDGTSTLLEDSQIGEILFPSGTTVDTRLDTRIYKLAYRYNFVADENTTIGASFGFHWMSIEFDIDGPASNLEETFDVDAPLPLLGLHWTYAFTPKWKLAASTEVLRFDLGTYRGYVSDTRLTLEHDLFEHVGWGIGYNAFTIDGYFDDEDDLDVDLEYGYQGLMLYLRTYF